MGKPHPKAPHSYILENAGWKGNTQNTKVCAEINYWNVESDFVGGWAAQLFQGRLALNLDYVNFNLGFCFFCLKAFPLIIFSILIKTLYHEIADKKTESEFAF